MSAPQRTWWVYALRTATGQLYCGISTDVQARLATHNRGQGAKFLRGSRLPCELLTSWRFDGEAAHADALRAEAWFKRQSTVRKWRIVRGEEGLGG